MKRFLPAIALVAGVIIGVTGYRAAANIAPFQWFLGNQDEKMMDDQAAIEGDAAVDIHRPTEDLNDDTGWEMRSDAEGNSTFFYVMNPEEEETFLNLEDGFSAEEFPWALDDEQVATKFLSGGMDGGEGPTRFDTKVSARASKGTSKKASAKAESVKMSAKASKKASANMSKKGSAGKCENQTPPAASNGRPKYVVGVTGKDKEAAQKNLKAACEAATPQCPAGCKDGGITVTPVKVNGSDDDGCRKNDRGGVTCGGNCSRSCS